MTELEMKFASPFVMFYLYWRKLKGLPPIRWSSEEELKQFASRLMNREKEFKEFIDCYDEPGSLSKLDNAVEVRKEWELAIGGIPNWIPHWYTPLA